MSNRLDKATILSMQADPRFFVCGLAGGLTLRFLDKAPGLRSGNPELMRRIAEIKARLAR